MAERLGKTVWELRAMMPTAEYAEWVALEELRAYRREQAKKKGKK